MFKFFDSIVDFIEILVNAFSAMVETVVTVIKQVVTGVIFVSETVTLLPPFCNGAFTMLIALCVCTLVLGAFIDFK